MRTRWVFLAGLGVGYVLGSRAGRERYEQLVAGVRRVTDNPTLQEAAGLAQAQAGRVVNAGREALGDKLGDTRIGQTRIAERLFGSHPYSPGSLHEPRGHQPRPNGAAQEG